MSFETSFDVSERVSVKKLAILIQFDHSIRIDAIRFDHRNALQYRARQVDIIPLT